MARAAGAGTPSKEWVKIFFVHIKGIFIQLIIVSLSTFLGCFSTLFLVGYGFDAVLSSSLVTFLLSVSLLIMGQQKTAMEGIFSGSFAGMISLPVLLFGEVTDPLSSLFFLCAFLLSCLSAGFLFAILKASHRYPKILCAGYGGRLGTIALIACIFYVAVGGFWFIYPVFQIAEIPFDYFGVLMVVFGAISTAYLVRLFDKGVIVASGLTVIFSLFVLFFTENSYFLAQAFYVGTFVGTTKPDIFPKISYFIFSSFLAGVFMSFILSCLNGLGGVLGFTAFCAVLMTKFGVKTLKMMEKDSADER